MQKRVNDALEYARKNKDNFLMNLMDYVSIPSVSTNPERIDDIENAALWTADQLKKLGGKNVQIFPTGGHPVVYGELLTSSSTKPTVLIYGHYDVQPAEPLELWHSPAFQPVQRGDNLFGRGTSDMKGQVMICLKAIESLIQTGDLPINLKFLIEGEEEIGSPNLGEFIRSHKDLLSCDFALNTDAGMIINDIPSITYGLRGLAYFELIVTGPDHDLHSGQFGGAVHNPAQVLCELITGMHDSEGRVTLPGFYDSVSPLTVDERYQLSQLPQNDEFYLRESGAPALFGEIGYSATERIGVRPTLEINGLVSGFTGVGSKTVLPSKAMAKISMRLVPFQDPDEVYSQLKHFLQENAPPTVKWDLNVIAGGPASISDREMRGVLTFVDAVEAIWGHKPYFKREGGSVPVVSQMQNILGIDSVLTGFGMIDDNLHAPNEKIHIPSYFKGIETFIYYFYLLGQNN